MDSLVDTGPAPACPAPFNLAAHVLAAGRRVPGKPALEVLHADGAEMWTHGDLARRVAAAAARLGAHGLAPGDRLLMRIGDAPEFPVVFLAAVQAGILPVPTSAALTAPEVATIVRDIAPAAIAAADAVTLPAAAPCPVLRSADLAAPPADSAPVAPAPHMGDPARPAFIVYTSGTSGAPRAVVHAHRAIWARGMMTEGWYGLRGDDRLLHAGAFNWTFTLGTGLLDPWTAGATALIPAPGTDAAALPGLLAAHGATIFAAAPGIHRRVLRAEMPALPALRHGLSAGERLSPALRTRWRAATGTDLHEAFGMSECSTFLSGSPARPAPDGATGFAQPGRRIALLDDAGGPVPRGMPGLIAVAATDPGLMLGYLGQAEETRARYSADGAWFLTGDIGAMDATGAITHLGRGDDMMNAGGVRVSPVEVEAAFLAHPAITDAAAVERPVASGATVIALHYVADGDLSDADLAAFAADRLARYKCPRIFVRETALPRGANNKLSRRTLRARAEQERTPP